MPAKRVVLFGSGGGADVAYRCFKQDTDVDIVGFTLDDRYRQQDTFRGLPCVAFEEVERHFPPESCRLFVLLGYQQMNRLRAEKYLEGKRKGYEFENYVHPRICVMGELEIGENCFVLDSQSINFDVRIGNNVVLWSANHIGDRSVIGDHAWLCSHVSLAGDVSVGEYSFLGINSCVSNFVRVAAQTFVGSHVTITQDTAPNGVYVAPRIKAAGIDSATFLKVMESGRKI